MLEQVPLHSPRKIERLFVHNQNGLIGLPAAIHVHCENNKCAGVRRHEWRRQGEFPVGLEELYLLTEYDCTNCLECHQIFGLKSRWDIKRVATSGTCTKIYQEPQFGSPTPKRFYEVIGEDNRNHFLQARRAIARGLGIGAYAYYRRIVESAKFDLIGSLIKVAEATNAVPAQIELLKRAQSERQFSKAIDLLREVSAIPPSLLISGHNPLLLLHDSLSKGIHELDDSECLERVREAETLLFHIATEVQMVLADQSAVKAALTNILRRKETSDKSVWPDPETKASRPPNFAP
jgi:hypothetical protein